MAFSKQDRANISVHSLIGYCQSAKVITCASVKRKELIRWVEGLLEITEVAASKLDELTE